jgi:hypothetical protein
MYLYGLQGARLQTCLAGPPIRVCHHHLPPPQSPSAFALLSSFGLHSRFSGRGSARELRAGQQKGQWRAVHRQLGAMAAAVPSLVDCDWLNARCGNPLSMTVNVLRMLRVMMTVTTMIVIFGDSNHVVFNGDDDHYYLSYHHSYNLSY